MSAWDVSRKALLAEADRMAHDSGSGAQTGEPAANGASAKDALLAHSPEQCRR